MSPFKCYSGKYYFSPFKESSAREVEGQTFFFLALTLFRGFARFEPCSPLLTRPGFSFSTRIKINTSLADGSVRSRRNVMYFFFLRLFSTDTNEYSNHKIDNVFFMPFHVNVYYSSDCGYKTKLITQFI